MKENNEGNEIKCKCGYKWTTLSTKKYVCCPDCLKKVKNEKVNKKAD